MKFYLTFIAIFLSVTAFCQNKIRGVVTSENKPVTNATVIISTTGKNQTDWEGKTDENGFFNIPITTTLPGVFSFTVVKKGFIANPIKTYSDGTNVVPLSIIYGYAPALNRLNKASQIISTILPNPPKVTNSSSPNQTKSNNSKPNNSVYNELNKEILRLNDTVTSLKTAILNNTIDVDNANSYSRELLDKIQFLTSRMKALESENIVLGRKVQVAYMDVVDCFCESYSSKKLELGFNIVDENHQFISDENRREVFRIVVKKIESLKSKNSGKERAITYNATGDSYIEKEVTFPTNRIKVVFTTDEPEFFDDKTFLALGKGKNYKVYIYNKEFNKVLNGEGLELTDLAKECFKRTNTELNSETRNRPVEITKQVEVNSTKIKILVYDDAEIDGDIITLYLNKQPILSNYSTNAKPKEIEITLNENEPNELMLFAENLGAYPPNTAKIKIIDNLVEYSEIILSSDKEKSEAIRIVVKRK